jgi:hypothetical protein
VHADRGVTVDTVPLQKLADASRLRFSGPDTGLAIG